MKQALCLVVLSIFLVNSALGMHVSADDAVQDDGVAKKGGCFGGCFKKSYSKTVSSQPSPKAALESQQELQQSVPLSPATRGLYWAVFNNSPELIAKHIKAGADVNAQDTSGCTPLHYAVMQKNLNCAELLVCCEGINTDVATPEGYTALSILKLRRDVAHGQERNMCDELIQCLLYDPNFVDSFFGSNSHTADDSLTEEKQH